MSALITRMTVITVEHVEMSALLTKFVTMVTVPAKIPKLCALETALIQ
jgi:hypothetical protein